MESMEHEEMRRNFMMVTGCSRAATDQYLQASEWNMETALDLLYESQSIKHHPLPPAVPPRPSRYQRSTRERGAVRPLVTDHHAEFSAEEHVRSRMENELRLSDTRKQNNVLPTSTVKKSRESTNTDTVNATKKVGRNPAESVGQSFYVGGSESSGQVVIDPSIGRTQHREINRVFDAARQQGAREISTDDRKVDRVSKKPERPVMDTSHTLGSSTASTIPKTNNQTRTKNQEVSSTPAEIIPIRFYSDGFIVGENGPLRQVAENQEFLACIKRGEVPPELKHGENNGRKIEISLEDHRQEQYRPPEYKFKSFDGTGNVLGLPGSRVSEVAPIARSSVPTRIPDTIDIPRLEKIAERYLKTSSKATVIRLRLPDVSTPLTIHIDLNRSLMDIRQMIIDNIPELRSNAFEFLEPPSTRIRAEDERRPISNTRFGHSTLAIHRINK